MRKLEKKEQETIVGLAYVSKLLVVRIVLHVTGGKYSALIKVAQLLYWKLNKKFESKSHWCQIHSSNRGSTVPNYQYSNELADPN